MLPFKVGLVKRRISVPTTLANRQQRPFFHLFRHLPYFSETFGGPFLLEVSLQVLENAFDKWMGLGRMHAGIPRHPCVRTKSYASGGVSLTLSIWFV